MGIPVTGLNRPQGGNSAVIRTQATSDGASGEVQELWGAQDRAITQLLKSGRYDEADLRLQQAIRTTADAGEGNPAYVARVHKLLGRAINNALRDELAEVGGKVVYNPGGEDTVHYGFVEIHVPNGPDGNKAYEAALQRLESSPYNAYFEAAGRRELAPDS